MKTPVKTYLQRLGMLCVCLLMLAAISLRKDGRLLGHDLRSKASREIADTARLSVSGDTIIVNTSLLSQDIIGYAGPTPIKVYVLDERIEKIDVLENYETPGFLKRASKVLFPQYIGKSVNEVRGMQVDAVTGCTYTSSALIDNMDLAMAQLPSDTSVLLPGHKDIGQIIKLVLAVLVSLMAAVLPLFIKNKTYRTVQLCLNVAVLGIYTATFVSFTSIVGAISNGLGWMNLALAVLLVVAFLYPLFGKKNHYCNWCCPYGAAQELMGRCSKKKIHLSAKVVKGLEWFQMILWAVLMVLAWSGVFFDWMDYELFSAFAWASAEWVVIAFAAVFLVLSIFVNRPYCRFVCPTGVMIKKL